MILGTLSLMEKRGIFYKELQLHSDDHYSELELKELHVAADNVYPDKAQETFKVRPLEVQGNTDYVNAQFEDLQKADYPYELTIWLLIEEQTCDIPGTKDSEK